MEVLIPIIVVIFVILAAIGSLIAAKKRREAIALLAGRLELRYSPDNDHELPRRYGFLDKLTQGSNRYAFNIMEGFYKEHDVQLFDFHYETYSTNSKGRRQTHHHYFSFFILTLERPFPELTISEEGLLSRFAQSFGYDDIDFESHEFSKKFCVRSPDKKFAYDVCHTRMMDYLLANDDLTIEIERGALTLWFDRRLEPEQIEHNLNRLIEVRKLMPQYLFS